VAWASVELAGSVPTQKRNGGNAFCDPGCGCRCR
jgi:hypothetical protein